MNSEIKSRWSSQTKLVVSVSLLILVIYLLFRFSIIFPPMILAIILAFILSPIVNFFQSRLRLRRGLATLLSYLILLAVLITLPMLLTPLLVAQVADFNVDIEMVVERAEILLGHDIRIAGFVIDGASIIQQVVVALRDLVEPIFTQTFELVVEVISSIVWIIFIFVVSFYLVKDGPTLKAWAEKLPPPAYREDFMQLRDDINQVWTSFFRGQLVLALVVSIIFTIAGFILGIPFALVMGLLAGLLEFLPSIGHGIWLVCTSVLAISIGSTWMPIPNWVFMLIIIGLHLIYQQFDLNYLIPRIIGRSVHLPPLVVILGIVAGAVFAGVLGIPLAAPTIASARIIGRYIYSNLFDLEPFPDSITHPLPPPDPRWWQAKRSRRIESSSNDANLP